MLAIADFPPAKLAAAARAKIVGRWRSVAHGAPSFHRALRRGKRYRRQMVFGEPRRLFSIIAGAKLTAQDVRTKNEHQMAVRVLNDVVISADQRRRFDLQAGFFSDFAHGGLFRGFAKLHEADRQAPRAGGGRGFSPNQQNVAAIFNVAYTRPNALTDDTVRLFTSLVNRAALSIANMQLFEQTKDLAVMEERNRLARDLHDSAKQKAFAALAQLGTVNGILKSKPTDAKSHLTEAETLVFEVIQELTFLIQEIYPIALQEKGLPTTLREYIFEWESRNDIGVKLTIRNERPLPLEIEQAVYRIIQEALANVARHSKAKRADVSLVYNTDSLQIMVADDGHGFDMNQRAKGMGFRSMRERINSVRGTIQIQSAPGQGTRMIAQLPIKPQGKETAA